MTTTVYTRDGQPKRVETVRLGADEPLVGAFSDLRVTARRALFVSKFIHDNDPLAWDDATTAGNAASSWNADTASVTLSVASGDGAGTRVRQTLQRFAYTPGRSMRVVLALTLGAAVTDVTKRAGCFDDTNGLFLQQTDAALAFVARSSTSGSPVDAAIAQSSWNMDRLDGSGASRLTLDAENTQTLVIDFEWPGGVRFGFVLDGRVVYAHQIRNANIVAVAYLSTPNLPVRFEIASDAAATAELVCMAAGVYDEGVQAHATRQYAIDTGIAGVTTDNDTDVYALVGWRLRADYPGARVRAARMHIYCASASYRWILLLDPTVADTFAYGDVTNTAIQSATGDTSNTVTGGFVLASGYGGPSGVALDLPHFEARALPGVSIAGVQGHVVLAVQNLVAGTETYHASLWIEDCE